MRAHRGRDLSALRVGLAKAGPSAVLAAAVAVALLAIAAWAQLGPSQSEPAQAAAPPGAGSAAATAAQDDEPGPEETLDDLGISGYPDRLSVQPGETVSFHVSSRSPRYRVELVRMFHANPDPRGPGIQEEPVPAPATGVHEGSRQSLGLGSYAEIDDAAALRLGGSFTISAWIAPTTIPGAKENLLAAANTPAHAPRPQGIVTKWSGNAGYGLYIDEHGSLSLRLGDGERAVDVSTGTRLRPWAASFPGWEATSQNDPAEGSPQGYETQWYFVAASYDAETGKATLYQRPQNHIPDPTRSLVTRDIGLAGPTGNDAPLRIAAGEGTGQGSVTDLYNGKIDNPRIYGEALTAAQLRGIEAGEEPATALANWDFSRGIRSAAITDDASRGLHGRTVNGPKRAVTGHDWSADENDYRRAPGQYGAIHFHQDDLRDAKWPVGFRYRVPADADSGVYAAKLRADGKVFYVPFAVRPREGRATARAALVLPTFSYLAYGEIGDSPNALSLYSRHVDGSGVTYSSSLRPLTTLQPTTRPRHFSGDMQLVYWLHAQGYDVDVLTDHDVHREGASLLNRYRVVLTGQHPEYITGREYDAFDSYVHGGGRLMYLGGNGFYWVTGSDRTNTYVEVRRRDGTQAWHAAPGESHLTTTAEEGGLWRFRGRAPQELLGVGFSAQAYGGTPNPATDARPYGRTEQSYGPQGAWVFEGLGADEAIGDHPSLFYPSGAAGDELDRVDHTLGSPANTVILATATGFSDGYQYVLEELNASDSKQGGTVNPMVKADMAYVKYRNGGGVFSVGSIAWDSSLLHNDANNSVSTVTGNVLDRFLKTQSLP